MGIELNLGINRVCRESVSLDPVKFTSELTKSITNHSTEIDILTLFISRNL